VCRMHIRRCVCGRNLVAYLQTQATGVASEWVPGPKAVWVVKVAVVLDSRKSKLCGAVKGVSLDRCRSGS
jgi:hypothetical protein